ncbi:MAG: copper resistance protein CopZ [Chloroflexi bacterium HGW-Chloroflexi-4]|jgi:copper chaperone CopZ|nr:MAG: copper resistance protein CopZ [Chloroflexi bacterium HGW-Chloroflexi-4]
MIKQITLKINGMECPNCAMILEGIEDKLKGVKSAEASYRKTQLIVEYEESLLSKDQIKAEVKRMGYEVADGI